MHVVPVLRPRLRRPTRWRSSAAARELGLLVMGPGCGTAMLGEVGLGFANVVRSGPVGIVAAAGTGAQEAAILLDGAGVGVSQIVGVGGRDLSAEVGGIMFARGDADARGRRRRPRRCCWSPSRRRARPSRRSATSTSTASAWSPRSSAGTAATAPFEIHPTLDAGRVRGRGRRRRPASPSSRRRSTSAAAPARLLGLYSGGSLAHEAVTVLDAAAGRDRRQRRRRRRRRPRDLRPRRGGVHAGPPAPDGRPRGAARACCDDGRRRRRLRAARRRDRPRLARRPGGRARRRRCARLAQRPPGDRPRVRHRRATRRTPSRQEAHAARGRRDRRAHQRRRGAAGREGAAHEDRDAHLLGQAARRRRARARGLRGAGAARARRRAVRARPRRRRAVPRHAACRVEPRPPRADRRAVRRAHPGDARGLRGRAAAAAAAASTSSTRRTACRPTRRSRCATRA